LGEGVVEVQTWSDAAIVLAEKHGFPHLLDIVRVPSGWALAEQGESQEASLLCRQDCVQSNVGRPF
jgi:hypothetical protein